MDTYNHWIFLFTIQYDLKLFIIFTRKNIYPRVEEGFNRIVDGH